MIVTIATLVVTFCSLIFYNSFGALGLIASTYIENKSHFKE